jgi:hypothetical protein
MQAFIEQDGTVKTFTIPHYVYTKYFYKQTLAKAIKDKVRVLSYADTICFEQVKRPNSKQISSMNELLKDSQYYRMVTAFERREQERTGYRPIRRVKIS